jgi:hypothetical protein
MSDHKFTVGQNVEFSPDWPIDDTTKGQYTIVALYPETGNIPQYRIKSKRDGHERMVQEDRLDRAAEFSYLPRTALRRCSTGYAREGHISRPHLT